MTEHTTPYEDLMSKNKSTANRDEFISNTERTSVDDQPYYIEKQTPATVPTAYWQTHITGPFINTVHLGVRQECGPQTVRLLNAAYRAGVRKAQRAATPGPRKTETAEV